MDGFFIAILISTITEGILHLLALYALIFQDQASLYSLCGNGYHHHKPLQTAASLVGRVYGYNHKDCSVDM